MPTTNTNTNITISHTKSGFPDYLDFGKMRSEAIAHLGPIASAYWTDYNEHDPGITTLEALLYALMDLGYRVNWPIEDLLARPGGAQDADYYTAAQVLGSTPFTINDYRKKLMDVNEVRNAWLKVAQEKGPGDIRLNGLYDVLLDLEKDASQFPTPEEWTAYRDTAVGKVKKILQEHRNLCEDFLDPVVFLKKPWAVKADIELSEGASIPAVYQELIQKLYNFFSPVPNYYTLDQLAALNIPLDQAFSGRPYVRRPSYGFILDSELPDLPGEDARTIYPSEVIELLLNVDGIEAVKNLEVAPVTTPDQWVNLVKGIGTYVWEIPLEQQTVPVLSVARTSFNWFLNGQQLSWTPGVASADLQRTLAYSGKVLHRFRSAELDRIPPQGQYLDGLGTYYSIQRDFPEVYGIGPGGLPASASPQRRAQAYQFKAYLLFFEQLMADFLAQLANVPQLLSLSGTADATKTDADPDDDPEDITGKGPDIDPPVGPLMDGTTALVAGDLSDVPDLDLLLRFPPISGQMAAGITLAFPVDAAKWKEMTEKGQVSCEDFGKLEPFLFDSWHERDLAIAELVLSFGVQPPEVVAFPLKGNAQWAFFIAGIRPDIVLLGKTIFGASDDASGAGKAALFAGASQMYYTLSEETIDGHLKYSFSLGQSNLDYYDYVGQLLANKQADVQRRTAILQHLVERFAESFLDYTRLSAGFLSTEAMAGAKLGLMQQFLDNLPALGADRGKGYNYTHDAWDTMNVSGFEQRFKAYCGIPDWRRHYLCPFEVAPAEQRFHIEVTLGGQRIMTNPGPLTREEGNEAIADLYRQMSTGEHYRMVGRNTRFAFAVTLHTGEVVESISDWPDTSGVAAAIGQMIRLWQLAPTEEAIVAHRMEYVAEVLDIDGRVVRTGRSTYADENAAFEDAGKKIHDIKESKYWHIPPGMEQEPGRLERSRDKDSHLYIDTKALDMPIKHDIPHKPEHCRFMVSDKSGAFSFAGAEQLPNSAAGRSASRALLILLTETGHYSVQREAGATAYRLFVVAEGKIVAAEVRPFADEEEARQHRDRVIGILRKRLYTLRMARTPIDWVFLISLGLPGTPSYVFRSSRAYADQAEAFRTAREFYDADGWELAGGQDGFRLYKTASATSDVHCVLEMHEGMPQADQLKKQLQEQVLAKSAVFSIHKDKPGSLEGWLAADAGSASGGFVYRLVDKDRPRAFHVMTRGSGGAGEAGGAGEVGGDAGPGGAAGAGGAGKAGGAGEAERLRQELVRRGYNGYVYPELCLGGDNVFYQQPEKGPGAWHYRIRCRNGYFSRLDSDHRDKEWVLFESIGGYPTEDAAQRAFQDYYLYILEKAMSRVNYGEKDFIAWDDKGKRLAIVYVPAEIREALEHAGDNVTDELIKAARSYPIRQKGWDQRQKDDARRRAAGFVPLTVPEAKTNNRSTGYLFQLLHHTDPSAEATMEEADWISAGMFAGAQDAHTAFNYFRLLLQTPGNFFIDFDEEACRWRIGIREILAESTGLFATEEKAWGTDGVQRFIGIAQTEGGWHAEKRADCSWGYFVACPNKKALHPCYYETEGQRDSVMKQLFEAAQGFPRSGWLGGSGPADPHDGHVIAKLPGVQAGAPFPDETTLNQILDMLDAAWAGLFYQDEQGLYVGAEGGAIRIRPAEAGSGSTTPADGGSGGISGGSGGLSGGTSGISGGSRGISGGARGITPAEASADRDKWEAQLLHYGAYFPIIRTTPVGAQAQYRLEIKLPGFAALPGKLYTDAACGCVGKEQGHELPCYAGWIGDSDYPTALEAWQAYESVLQLLAIRANYRPVHDPAALSFGIKLLPAASILARSVQPYFYAKMAERSLHRADDCVNMEGLNVVEHLLLRKDGGAGTGAGRGPGSEAGGGAGTGAGGDSGAGAGGDSSAGADIGTGTEAGGESGAAIPVCSSGDNPSIGTYQPGVDPYSFIMTVFLPAWPRRFRKKENRQLLESILQREAPAHILPRILWLTPMDMCRMESAYKKWLLWLKNGKGCGDFHPDWLLSLLFETPFDCLEDVGCGTDSGQAMKDMKDEWLSEISRLYCWKDRVCADTSQWHTGCADDGCVGDKTGDEDSDKQLFRPGGKELQRPTFKEWKLEEEKPPRPTPPKPLLPPHDPSIFDRVIAFLKKVFNKLAALFKKWWRKITEWSGRWINRGGSLVKEYITNKNSRS